MSDRSNTPSDLHRFAAKLARQGYSHETGAVHDPADEITKLASGLPRVGISWPTPEAGKEVVVTLGRFYRPCNMELQAANHFMTSIGASVVVHGGADGDRYVARKLLEMDPERRQVEVPADWDRHGRAAGPIRNAEMIARSPAAVIAFRGGRGTADTVRRANAADVPVRVVLRELESREDAR